MPDERYYTRRELPDLLREHGYPSMKLAYLEVLCSPAIGKGPPEAARWGGGVGRALYKASDVLAWAESRLRPARKAMGFTPSNEAAA